MPLIRKRAARFPRAAPGIATSPNAAATLSSAKDRVVSASRKAMRDCAACHVDAARADFVAVMHEDRGAAFANEIAALAADVAVLHISGKSLSPGEAAVIVDRTEPATHIVSRPG